MAISPAPESQQRPTTVEKLCSGAQSRFSAFFHGQSVLTRERYRTAQVGLKAANSYRTREHSERDGLRRAGPVSRSRTSTRSVIDSPISNPGSPHTEELWQYRGAFFRPVSTLGPAPRVTTVIRGGVEDRNTTRHERLLLCRKPKHKRGCFAAIEDRHIKHKIVGSLISGSLLVLFLTICKWACTCLKAGTDDMSRSGAGSIRLDSKYKFPRCHDCLHPGTDYGLLPFPYPTLHAELSHSPSRATSNRARA